MAKKASETLGWYELFRFIVQRNFLLFEKPGHYSIITTVRLLGLFCVFSAIKLMIFWNGTFPKWIDMSMIISLLVSFFAVGMSWAFFHSAQTASDATTQQLLKYLSGMQDENRHLWMSSNKGGENGVPREVADRAKDASENPGSEESRFSLAESLLDEPTKQILVLMKKIDIKIPLSEQITCEFITRKTRNAGGFSGDRLKTTLAGTGFIRVDQVNSQDTLVLTDAGKKFADWLITNDKAAIGFKSNIGNFGDPAKVVSISVNTGDTTSKPSVSATNTSPGDVAHTDT